MPLSYSKTPCPVSDPPHTSGWSCPRHFQNTLSRRHAVSSSREEPQRTRPEETRTQSAFALLINSDAFASLFHMCISNSLIIRMSCLYVLLRIVACWRFTAWSCDLSLLCEHYWLPIILRSVEYEQGVLAHRCLCGLYVDASI